MKKSSGLAFFIISFLFSILLAVSSSLILHFSFVNNCFKLSEEYNEEVGSFERVEYNYFVKDCLEKQAEEFKTNEFVSDTFGYYNYASAIKYNNKSIKTRVTFSQSNNGIEISSYSLKNCIEGTNDIVEGEILIDKNIADSLNLKIGDNVKISFLKVSDLEFKVKGIFLNNNLYDNGSMYFLYTGQIKEAIDKVFTPSNFGILIKAKELIECFNYLKDAYIPYGRMLTRDYFSSNVEYDEYLNNFKNHDYSSEIYNKQRIYESKKAINLNLLKDADKQLWIGTIVSSIVMLLLIAIPVIAIFYELNYEKRTKSIISNKTYKKNINIELIVGFVIAFVLPIVLAAISQSNVDTYSNILNDLLLKYGITTIVSLLIVLLISNTLIRKINNKKY